MLTTVLLAQFEYAFINENVGFVFGFRSSSGYGDELAWGAIWLYRATQDVAYLNDAKAFYNQYGLSGAGEFSWDSKAAGVQVVRDSVLFAFFKRL